MAATFGVLLATTPAIAGGDWSAPVHFDDQPSSTAVDRPAVALQGGGMVHVALATVGSEPGIRLHSIGGGGVIVDRVTTRRDRQPSLAIGDDGVFHLAFSRRATGCDESPCTAGIFYARSANGDDWTVQRVHRGERDVHPSLALDPSGRPWIYFRAGNRIVESHRSGGEWSNATIAFDCCGGDPLSGPEATVVGGQGHSRGGAIDGISPFQRLGVWREEFDGGTIVLSLFELDFVETFIVTRQDDAFDPDLVLTAEEDLYVAYRRVGDGLWFAEFQPNGRFERTQIASAEILGTPAIEALPGGAALVVAATTNGRLIFRTNASGSWAGGPIPMTGGTSEEPGLETTGTGAARVAFLRADSLDGFWFTQHGPNW